MESHRRKKKKRGTDVFCEFNVFMKSEGFWYLSYHPNPDPCQATMTSTMKRALPVFLLLQAMLQVSAQKLDFQESLNGFMLGQYRDAARTSYKEPLIVDVHEDGVEYEIYLLKPDTSLYMIFEYAPQSRDLIWSIQVFGKGYDPDFMGLTLGMSESEVTEIMGRNPDFTKSAGQYGKQIAYDSCNYSFEINPSGELSSIKLIDESYLYFTGSTDEQPPRFSEIKSLLNAEENAEIAEILAPDLEVYVGDTVYYFKSSFQAEMATDYSGIFELIRQYASELEEIVEGNQEAYEQNIRLSVGSNPMHVIKFTDSYRIRELVFKYQYDRYMLWEIALKE